MHRHFDDDLAALKHELIRMSAIAESMIREAIDAVVNRNDRAAPIVYEREKQVNAMQIEIDEMCLRLIALYQPAASDLRFILGAAKTNTDLERLADQAVNIVHKAEKLRGERVASDCAVIAEMAEVARRMLTDSLHCFVNRDPQKAREVLQRDDRLDQLKVDLTAQLTRRMTEDSSSINRAIALILLVRNLERIGDHATNIAENTIFVVEGKDVRHHGDVAGTSVAESK